VEDRHHPHNTLHAWRMTQVVVVVVVVVADPERCRCDTRMIAAGSHLGAIAAKLTTAPPLASTETGFINRGLENRHRTHKSKSLSLIIDSNLPSLPTNQPTTQPTKVV
jgi:hypothetical protein